MNNERTNLDVNRMYGGHLGQTYYEYKDEEKGDKYNLQPRMMRTWQLRRIPIIASPKDPYGYDDEPRFRWTVTNWSLEKHQDWMKPWHPSYQKAFGLFQGSML